MACYAENTEKRPLQKMQMGKLRRATSCGEVVLTGKYSLGIPQKFHNIDSNIHIKSAQIPNGACLYRCYRYTYHLKNHNDMHTKTCYL